MTRLHLPPDWQLPATFVQRLGDNAGRQRAMSADGHLLLVLHEPPAAGAPERTGRAFWRDPAGEVERAVELLHGDVRNGLDFTIAHQAERQAEQAHGMAVAGYRLNLLAALFVPITALGSVFGMHLAHGLDAWATPAHFWGVV